MFQFYIRTLVQRLQVLQIIEIFLLTQRDKIFFNVQYKNVCLFQLQENIRRSIPLAVHKSPDSVLIGFQNIY